MKRVSWQGLLAIASLLLIAVGVAAWFYFMEPVRQKFPFESDAAARDPMLAAAKLLRLEHFTVQSFPTLDVQALQAQKAGVLLINEGNHISSWDDYNRLLSWVEQGGVLITLADWDPGEEDGQRVLPLLGDKFHTWLKDASEDNETEDDTSGDTNEDLPPENEIQSVELLAKAEPPPCLLTTHTNLHSLTVQHSDLSLYVAEQAPTSLWPVDECSLQRVYAHGRGKVVLLSQQPFDNETLKQFDHAEWLLALVNLQTDSKTIWLVQSFNMPAWYVWLWRKFPLTLLLLAIGMLIFVWHHWIRFGPLMPSFYSSRRALLEHIDASAHWLWRSEKGRQRLLDALRARVQHKIVLRYPWLAARQGVELIDALCAHLPYTAAQLESALLAPAGKTPPLFYQQIHILQGMRKHYE